MIVKRARGLMAPLLFTVWVCGCETSDPGGGFTNGPPPTIAPENPAVRTDQPPPDIRDADLAAGRDKAGSSGGNASSSKGGAGASEPTKLPEGSAPAPPPNSP